MPSPSDLKLRKEELFDLVGYKPHPGQLQIHRSRAKRRVIACGTRFGKSVVGIHECVAYLLEPRETARGWLVAPTLDLTHRIFEHVVAILQSRFAHRVVGFDTRNHRIVVVNLAGGQSELRAMSADRPAGLLGESLDFLVIDEAASIREGTWEGHLAPRVLDRRGSVLLLSTPDGGGWFFREFRRGQKGRDADYESFQLPSSMNPHLPADAIEAERKRLPPEVFAAQYEAQFVNVPLEVCATCKGPAYGAMRILFIHDGLEPARCVECGEIVNEDGSTAVGLTEDGEREATVIIYGEESPDPSTVPPIDGIDDMPDYCRAVVIHKPNPNDPTPALPDGIA